MKKHILYIMLMITFDNYSMELPEMDIDSEALVALATQLENEENTLPPLPVELYCETNEEKESSPIAQQEKLPTKKRRKNKSERDIRATKKVVQPWMTTMKNYIFPIPDGGHTSLLALFDDAPGEKPRQFSWGNFSQECNEAFYTTQCSVCHITLKNFTDSFHTVIKDHRRLCYHSLPEKWKIISPTKYFRFAATCPFFGEPNVYNQKCYFEILPYIVSLGKIITTIPKQLQIHALRFHKKTASDKLLSPHITYIGVVSKNNQNQ